MSKPDIQIVKNYLLNLQDQICNLIKSMDDQVKIIEDNWLHQEGGGGRTRAISQGHIFEKAGVNFSEVRGKKLPATATAHRPQMAGSLYEAASISLIIHPVNPYIPTCHANLRFFIVENAEGDYVWWFGGGYDLTPYYGFEEDCIHWHSIAKKACDPFGSHVYPKYKEWADNYFFIKHRNEPRGIGGIFFDDLNEGDFDRCFEFLQSVGNSFIEAYFPIVERRKELTYTQRERDFQSYRRGRYVEFNLVYDRGTLFGLQSGGRIESILISLPPVVEWHYNWQPELGSAEEELYKKYLVPKDWACQA